MQSKFDGGGWVWPLGVDDEGLPSGREEAELLSLRATFCVRDIWEGHWDLQGQKTIYNQCCPVEESLANESGRTVDREQRLGRDSQRTRLDGL